MSKNRLAGAAMLAMVAGGAGCSEDNLSVPPDAPDSSLLTCSNAINGGIQRPTDDPDTEVDESTIDWKIQPWNGRTGRFALNRFLRSEEGENEDDSLGVKLEAEICVDTNALYRMMERRCLDNEFKTTPDLPWSADNTPFGLDVTAAMEADQWGTPLAPYGEEPMPCRPGEDDFVNHFDNSGFGIGDKEDLVVVLNTSRGLVNVTIGGWVERDAETGAWSHADGPNPMILNGDLPSLVDDGSLRVSTDVGEGPFTDPVWGTNLTGSAPWTPVDVCIDEISIKNTPQSDEEPRVIDLEEYRDEDTGCIAPPASIEIPEDPDAEETPDEEAA